MCYEMKQTFDHNIFLKNVLSYHYPIHKKSGNFFLTRNYLKYEDSTKQKKNLIADTQRTHSLNLKCPRGNALKMVKILEVLYGYNEDRSIRAIFDV